MNFSIKTKGFSDTIDITDFLREAVNKSGVENGVCFASCPREREIMIKVVKS